MDKFNVIDQTASIDDLENDYVAWSSLPYSFRRHADDDCIRKNGMTNQQYYDKMKAKLLTHGDPDYVGESSDFAFQLDEDYRKKVEAAEQLIVSPNIEIIIPYRASSEEELIQSFERYQYLAYKDRLLSDEYSYQIWGYRVEDIFTFEKERFVQDNSPIPADESATVVDEYAEECKHIKDVTESMMARDDKIGLLQNRIHQFYDGLPEAIYESYQKLDSDVMSVVEQRLSRADWFDSMPAFVPFFTPGEMVNRPMVESMDYHTWKTNLLEAYDHKDEVKLLELGWNPSVELNESNLKYAKKRWVNWLENYLPKIVDIQGINERFDKEALLESTQNMREFYQLKNLYPIFIVLSFANTPFGNIIRAIKGSTYTHAGISTDSDLKAIYSFNFSNEYNGFTKDTLSQYISTNRNAIIDVLCIFVDGQTKQKIDDTLMEFEKNKKKTSYSFGNIINMLFNRAKEYPYPENLALVCSQFVDLILKLANIDLIDKPNNLVLPQDFAELSSNPKVYKVYEGYARNYKDDNVERDIGILFTHRKVVDIKYKAGLKIDFSKIKNKNGVIESLNMIDDLLMPTKVISEKFLPVKVSNKGDITISFEKDLEQQYQESHKLLTTYDKDNLIGIKHELAHLFYMNSLIENKIKRMKKGDASYKTLVDLRARILNDFKTYMKEVSKADPDFDFSKYFQDSEYYNGAVTIDHGLMKLSGKLIQKIIARGLK